MAYTASYLAAATIRGMLTNVISTMKPTADSMYIGLFNNSFSGGTQSDDPARYNSGSYATANEVTSTDTNWPTGGVALVSPILTMIGTSGSTASTSVVADGVGINFSASNVSETATTLTNAYGAIIYDSTLSDYVLVNISFGGGFSTTAGTFAITWATANSVSSIFYIQLH